MSFVSRGARAAARPLRRSAQHQSRRYAGHEAGHGAHGEAHHGESALHVAGGPANESFGKGFYITLATFPLAYVVYSIASSPGDNALSRLVKKYEAGKEDDERANVIHSKMMEQAAADRQLFASSPRDETGPPVRNQEIIFNAGSPWNVSAGHGRADLSAATQYYEQKNKDIEAERIERLTRNKGRSVYD